MIDFGQYTAKAIEKEMLKQVPSDIDTREGSMIQTAVGPAAWYLEGLYLLLAQMQDNASADKAVGEYLDRKAAERGLTRNPAGAAVRKGSFNVMVPAGARFKTINGSDSVIFSTGEFLSQTEDGYSYKMLCSTPGIIGNHYVGNLLPITAVSGLNSAVLGELIIAGVEEESDDSLRARFYDTFNKAAFGGNIQSYRKAILEITGVGAVQVYPVWQGGGTVLCSILDDAFKPALPALVEQVQRAVCPPEEGEAEPSAYGYGLAPIGAKVTITTATPLQLDIRCSIEFASGTQDEISLYQSAIEEKIEEYLKTVSKSWGAPVKGYKVDYSITVYVSRIIFAILSIEQIVNVTDVLINGLGEDLHLIETANLQQIPVLGTVVIHNG